MKASVQVGPFSLGGGFILSVFLMLASPGFGSGQGHTLVGPDGAVDWNRYYTSTETEQILRELHALYPELTELYSIGRSYQGRELWLMEVTAESTGGRFPARAVALAGALSFWPSVAVTVTSIRSPLFRSTR